MVALLMIAIVLILTGQYANLKMKKRISSLKQFIVLIESINSQISFSKKNIIEIISDLSCNDEMKLKTIYEFNKSNVNNFSENWKTTVIDFSRYDCLTKEDEKILLSFGKNLGVTDLQGQSSNCRLHIEMLKKQLENAEENLRVKSKINTALSSFSAAAAVIIFY